MTNSFLHGVEVVEISTGSHPIEIASSSVIGIIGTAPDADVSLFPLNTPFLIAGNRTDAVGLGTNGTLPNAIDSILDQTGAIIVGIRVDSTGNAAVQKAAVIGGVDPSTGAYNGVYGFLGAESLLGVRPRILIAPGFTGARATGAVTSFTIGTPGTGYTTAPTVALAAPPTGGRQATATATVTAGSVTAITITDPGYGYVSAPAVTFSGGGGTGAAATSAIGTVRDSVVAEMQGIAARLRAIIIADCPNTNDAAAIAYRNDFGDSRVWPVDPYLVVDRSGTLTPEPASSRFAGVLARTDNAEGFWVSPSNKEIFGISATARPIDFVMGDPSSRANILNQNCVATVIRQDGFRTWGNRSCSSDSKFAFLSVRRTADIINDSILAAHLWAVDRNITRTYIEDVTEGVNDFLRSLKVKGAIVDGKCWADPAKNTPDQIALGHATFTFDFSPTYPAEHVTIQSQLTNDYLTELFS